MKNIFLTGAMLLFLTTAAPAFSESNEEAAHRSGAIVSAVEGFARASAGDSRTVNYKIISYLDISSSVRVEFPGEVIKTFVARRTARTQARYFIGDVKSYIHSFEAEIIVPADSVSDLATVGFYVQDNDVDSSRSMFALFPAGIIQRPVGEQAKGFSWDIDAAGTTGSNGDATTFQSPIRSTDVTFNCYGFGTNVPANGGYHVGKDYCTDEGDPVYAANHGRVVYADSSNNQGFGTTVIIEHVLTQNIDQGGYGLSDTIYTMYSHLNSLDVSTSDPTVSKGEQIGTVGRTGSGAGSYYHLHYEIKFSDILGLPNPNSLTIGSDFGYDVNQPLDIGFLSPDTIVDNQNYLVSP